MIPEWSVPVHILLFVGQFILLVGIWRLINLLAAFFDKHIPFSTNPARRIGIQVASSIGIVAPIIIGIAVLVGPYMPDFVNNKFIILIIVTRLPFVLRTSDSRSLLPFAPGHPC